MHPGDWGSSRNVLYCLTYQKNQSCDSADMGIVLFLGMQQSCNSKLVLLVSLCFQTVTGHGTSQACPPGKSGNWFGTCTARKLLRCAWQWHCRVAQVLWKSGFLNSSARKFRLSIVKVYVSLAGSKGNILCSQGFFLALPLSQLQWSLCSLSSRVTKTITNAAVGCVANSYL